MKAHRIGVALTALGLAACTPIAQSTGEQRGRDVPAAKAIGKAQSCIPLGQISESRVRDDWTIDFRMVGNKWYRNTLPYRCSGLGFERAFSYSTSLSQLCSSDIITVIQSSAPMMSRGSCGLGPFQPVELVK